MAAADDTVPLEQKGAEGSRVDAAEALALSRAPGLVYFGNRLCPFAHRAWWAMHEKGVTSEFRYVHVDLGEDKPEWFKDSINPSGTVPCIFDAGRPVFESAICVEYLEDKFPGRGTALMPADSAQRAAVRLFVSQLDFGCFYAFLMNQDRAADAEHATKCDAALRSIESRYSAASPTGPFFLGEALSAADMALLPFVARFQAGLRAHRGWDPVAVAVAGAAPRVVAALAAARTRPAWQATEPTAAFIAAVYSGYASGHRTVFRRVPAAMLAQA